MTLHKVVTYRSDSDSIVSRWNNLPVDADSWKNFQNARYPKELQVDYFDFWNEIALNMFGINYNRTTRGLYNLHWLLPNELPVSLNI